jgi:hypothetical protein
MIWCQAAMVTWALVFSDPAADSVTTQPTSSMCFSEQFACMGAAMAANNAFALDHSTHIAACEQQPAANTGAGGASLFWKRN